MSEPNRIPPFSLWTFSGVAALEESIYHSAPDSVKIPVESGFASSRSANSPDFDVEAGVEITLTFYAKYADLVGDDTKLDISVQHKDAGGSWVDAITEKTLDEFTDGWVEYSATFTPAGAVDAIKIIGSGDAGGSGDSANAYIDTLIYPQLGGRTKTLRDALIADMQRIKAYDGFYTTVRDVHREPPPWQEMRKPCISVFATSHGSTESDSTCYRKASHDFAIMAVINGDVDAIDNFMDDIRNAVEHPDSNLNVATPDGEVAVTDWSEPEMDEDIKRDTYVRTAIVSVVYYYTEGAL